MENKLEKGINVQAEIFLIEKRFNNFLKENIFNYDEKTAYDVFYNIEQMAFGIKKKNGAGSEDYIKYFEREDKMELLNKFATENNVYAMTF